MGAGFLRPNLLQCLGRAGTVHDLMQCYFCSLVRELQLSNLDSPRLQSGRNMAKLLGPPFARWPNLCGGAASIQFV